MNTGIEKKNRKGRALGDPRRRLVALLLALVQCVSLTFASAPSAFADDVSVEDAVQTVETEPSNEPEPIVEEEPEPESIRYSLEAALEDQLLVTLTYDESAGIPDNAELRIRIPQLPPEQKPEETEKAEETEETESEEQDKDAGEEEQSPETKNEAKPVSDPLYLSAQQQENYLAQARRVIGLRESDLLFSLDLFELSIQADGKTVTPTAPVELRVCFLQADSSQEETFAVMHVEENSAYEMSSLSLLEDGLCTLYVTDAELGMTAFSSCAWMQYHAQTEYLDISLYGPSSALVDFLDLDVAAPEGQQVLESLCYVAQSRAASYMTSIWADVKPLQERDGELSLYALKGPSPFYLLSGSASTEGPVYMGQADGIALVAPAPEEEDAVLYSSDVLCLVGDAPKGLVVNAVDVSADFAEIDLASFLVEQSAATKSAKRGAKLMRSAAAESETGAKNYVLIGAYDISLLLDGKEYQPEPGKPILVSITDPAIGADRSLELWHIHDDGSREKVPFTVEGYTLSFEADSFSLYVLVGEDGKDVPTWTFVFMEEVPGDGSTVSYVEMSGMPNQVVKNGEKPLVPQPASDGTHEFAGWYTADPDSSEVNLVKLFDFDSDDYDEDGEPGFTESGSTILYPKYTGYAHVVFHDQYDSSTDTWPIAFTRRAELAEGSAQIRINDLSVGYTGSESMGFFGWSEKRITTPGVYRDPDTLVSYAISWADNDPNYGLISVTKDIHLYPIFRSIHWLTFYSAQSGQNAAYIPPQYAFDGEGIESPLPTTSRDGYQFEGWYTGTLTVTTEAGKTVETVNYSRQVTDYEGALTNGLTPYLDTADGGVYVSQSKLHLSSDATLYAKWGATYNIVIWRQRPSDAINENDADNTYEYYQTITENAETGVSVSFDSSILSIPGYVYDHNDGPKTIGSTGAVTVLNVYYDLDHPYLPSSVGHTLSFADSVENTGVTMPNAVTGLQYGASLADYAGIKPDNRKSGDNVIYRFRAWYMDKACTVAADLSTMTMPDRDLTLYAGWSPEWFIVNIDTNYGALYYYDGGVLKGTGSTWFWQTYDNEPIGEYTQATRDYVPSSAGEYYFVNRDRAYYGYSGNEWDNSEPDRQTYYTRNISEATEDTTFEYAPGSYSYDGWYEVYPDGTEAAEPYDFTQHTDHDTTLRLRWKRIGSFYLAFDAGEGTLENGTDKRDQVADLTDAFSDYAEIVMNRMANPPEGYVFVGWRLRGSETGRVYSTGQSFTLRGDDSTRESGKDVVWLEAVYDKVGTAKIIYNANGGTIAEGADAGQIQDNRGNWVAASGELSNGTLIVRNLVNNSHVKLSDGSSSGFTAPDGASFVGWCHSPVYDPAKDTLFTPGVEYGVDTNEPETLYAVWSVPVTYHLNVPAGESASDYGWGDEAWDSSVYNQVGDAYVQTAYLGGILSAPTEVPQYRGSQSKLFRFWATTDNIPTDDPTSVAYNFGDPVSGPMDLYACWREPVRMPVHAVNASSETMAEENTWLASGADTTLSVGADAIPLNLDTAKSCMSETVRGKLDSGDYVFAFAVSHKLTDPVTAITEAEKINEVYYNSAERHIFARFADGRDLALTEGEDQIYFVLYEKKPLNIGYRSVPASGELKELAALSGSAPDQTDELGSYEMNSHITQPLGWVSGSYEQYAFAIGAAGATNVSGLELITATSASDSARPTLLLRNTWRGFQYKTGTGEQAEWVDCGYAPTLYVVYYEHLPTVVMFQEKTVGSDTVRHTFFQYDLTITQTTTTTRTEQKQHKISDTQWEDVGEPTVTTETETAPVFDENTEDYAPYMLSDGQSGAAILFYYESTEETYGSEFTEGGEPGEPGEGGESGEPVEAVTYRNKISTHAVTTQSIKISQTANSAFDTAIDVDGVAYTADPYVYTYTAHSAGGSDIVTYTNSHKSLPVEVHVALMEDDGSITLHDNDLRSFDSEKYSFALNLGESADLTTKLPSIFTGVSADYALGAIFTGSDANNVVTVADRGVNTLSYGLVSGNRYELLLNGKAESPLGENKLYFLYYKMPQVQYVKQIDNALQKVTGGTSDPEKITYNAEQLIMNGVAVVQNQRLSLPVNGVLVISQSGNNFRMPPNLDDGIYARYLTFTKLGTGAADLTDANALTLFDAQTVHLRLGETDTGYALQYSATGSEPWTALADAAIYAVYEERGYDLLVSKTIDTRESGANPIFTEATFTVTIESESITKSSYPVEGFESESISADPVNHRIVLEDVGDGTAIRIKGLGHGSYTVTETLNENYVLSATRGPIVGSGETQTLGVTQLADGSGSKITLNLNTETKLELTNKPRQLCRITDGGAQHIFYTLADAIDYVENNIADRKATIVMLSSYLMPEEDAGNIPAEFDITLTAGAPELTITRSPRSEGMKDLPLFRNDGKLSIEGLKLDGGGIEATAPLIQSAGDLTIGADMLLTGGINSGNGGAINATAGNVTVNAGIISGNSAQNGAAIYYSGSGTVTVSGGSITGNTAAGNGGAIYAMQGTLTLGGSSGTASITGNEAVNRGGAIYAGNAIIEVKENAILKSNTAPMGGAIYADTATMQISGGSITQNFATDGDGGAIYVGKGSVKVSGGSFTGNQATNGDGGAIWANSAAVNVSDKAVFQGNQAKNGGAIYAQIGAVTATNPESADHPSFIGNIANGGSGGAIYAGSGNVRLPGVSMTGNQAKYDAESAAGGNGGAVYAGSGYIALTDATIQNNQAVNGGAVYANTGTVTVTNGSASGNKATTGNGGAIYAGSGAVTVNMNSASSMSGNEAKNGSGGAIYAGTGRVSVSGGSLSANEAKNGGAVCSTSGSVGFDGTALTGNKASTGNGGAVYANTGAVTATGVTATGNTASNGSGGVIFAGEGGVTLTNSTFGGSDSASANKAKSGGVIYVDKGTVSAVTSSFTGNEATAGSGGAICTASGGVTTSNTSFSGNKATAAAGVEGSGSGGAIATGSGTVSVSNSVKNIVMNGNTASGGNGGAIYADTGSITLSHSLSAVNDRASMNGNNATAASGVEGTGNGGAVYAESGNVSIPGSWNINDNIAAQYGGALYIGSGTLTISGSIGSVDFYRNRAVNGAAIFVNEGAANFAQTNGKNINVQTNVATGDGGAIGVGDESARLYCANNVFIKGNTQTSGVTANLYLDKNTDSIINANGLSGSAEIGIYVCGPFDEELFKDRGAASSLFASYTSENNLAKFKNDRNSNLTALKADNNKVRWVKAIKVEVRYLEQFTSTSFPPAATGTTLFTLNTYYLPSSEEGASQIAADIYANYNTAQLKNVYPNAGFACAFAQGETSFDHYLTDVKWNGATNRWEFTQRDGELAKKSDGSINNETLIIYFSASTYLSLTNNTEDPARNLTISELSVLGKDAVSDYYGYVTAKNGQTLDKMEPITADTLTIPAGHSIKFLFPGATGQAISLSGSFSGADGSVPYKLDGEPQSPNLPLTFTHEENLPNLTLPGDGKTRELLFGEKKLSICKVYIDDEENGEEKTSFAEAVAYIVAQNDTSVPYTIAMLVDYLQLPNDTLDIPDGYQIVLTTDADYSGSSEDGRAVLSRDAGKTGAMIVSNQNTVVNNAYHASLTIQDLILDGRALVGSGDGGAVNTLNATVAVDNVLFKGFEATNGGAIYVDFDTENNLTAYQNTTAAYEATLIITDSEFDKCRSSSSVDKTGGGAIWTTARDFTLTGSQFTGCSCYVDPGSDKGTPQAGAVFHNINDTRRKKAYSANTHFWLGDCTFKDCYVIQASGGAVESDALYVEIYDCEFDTCYSVRKKNGGAINVYADNKEDPSVACYTIIRNCTFNSCSSKNNGGAIRTTSQYVTLEDLSIQKCTSGNGGAVAATGSKAVQLEVYGCTIDSCTAANGGGIYSTAKVVIVGDSDANSTLIANCSGTNKDNGGGGIYQNRDGGDSFTMTNATVLNNTSGGLGGGIYTKAKTVTLTGGSISGNTANVSGGGIYQSKDTSFTMSGTTISRNTAKTGLGGGVYTVAKTVSLTNGEISGNIATVGSGGGLYTNAKTSLIANGTAFRKNESGSDGGAIWYDGADDDARAKMKLELKGVTVDGNSAKGNGGGVYTLVKTVTLGDASKRTSLSGNIAGASGGALYHDLNTDKTVLTVTNADIDNNRANEEGSTGVGGGIRTSARTVTVTDSSISGNIAGSSGGGIWLDDLTDTNRSVMSLSVVGSSLDNNASGGFGGAIYSCVKKISVQNNGDTRSSVSGNSSAQNGGGIYQNRSESGSELKITNADIDNNEANGSDAYGLGGGVFTNAWTVTAQGAEISGNSSTNYGAGLYVFDQDNQSSMSLSVSDSTLERDSSGSSGGGIYTNVKTLTVKDDCTFTDCVAAQSGGGIYHSSTADGASTSVGNTVFEICKANGEGTGNGGGAIYADTESLTLTEVDLTGNTAASKGGGLFYAFSRPFDENNPGFAGLVLDACEMTGNMAVQGGAVYTESCVQLCNETSITNNRLSHEDATKAAGMYLPDSVTLIVGKPLSSAEINSLNNLSPDDITEELSVFDTVNIHDNVAENGRPSNLRIWSGTDDQNDWRSVRVNRPMHGEIRVVNANTVGTQFGLWAAPESVDVTEFGFLLDKSDAVFKADYATYYGGIERSDPTRRNIIWVGPPVCKITDGAGNLLYLQSLSQSDGSKKGTDAAVFDKLDDGNPDGSITSAFNLLRNSAPTLYRADGEPYTEQVFIVKMLDNFTTKSQVRIEDYPGRTITFTTAGINDDDEYPSKVKTATVTRGDEVGGDQPLFVTEGNLTLENIVLDGGSLSGIPAGSDSSLLRIDQTGDEDITVTIRGGAWLQNAWTNGDGGGVYVNKGTLVIGDGSNVNDPTNGYIRNCHSGGGSGGGIYAADNGKVVLNRGIISLCSAEKFGGGICLAAATADGLEMYGGTIERCTAESGGGLYVGDGRNVHMTGITSRIANNTATVSGGGIAPGGANARVYFSGKPTVTGNTVNGVKRNLELDVRSVSVIQVEVNGSYKGLRNGANIGVFVADTDAEGNPVYDGYGQETNRFGTYSGEGCNEKTFYCFVNDRNGLKGGIISNAEPNAIYWVKIFSLEVSLKSDSIPATDQYKSFWFEVRLVDDLDNMVPGQLTAKDIEGEFGGMTFHSDGVSSTTALVELKLGENDTWENGVSCTAENLSYGLLYTIRPFVPTDTTQAQFANAVDLENYAMAPAQYAGYIGENNAPDKDVPQTEKYISRAPFRAVYAVCKLLTEAERLLYTSPDYIFSLYRETLQETASRAHIPAVFPQIQGAVDAILDTDLYPSVDAPTRYTIGDGSNHDGAEIHMLQSSYYLPAQVAMPAGKAITLTTSSSDAERYKYRGQPGTLTTITRNSSDGSMFRSYGLLTMTQITLDGANTLFPAINTDGGIVNVPNGGSLTITDGATLQYSTVSGKGGAVYAADGAKVTMNAGRIRENVVENGKGAGIYLSAGSKLFLSGNPNFLSADYVPTTLYTERFFNLDGWYPGNEDHYNGGQLYRRTYQDIYLAEANEDAPQSIVITGALTGLPGSIWVWAESEYHYKQLMPFAKLADGVVFSDEPTAGQFSSEQLKVFRNAQDDDTSENSTETYLYGVDGVEFDLDAGYVYWSGVKGTREVVLRKLSSASVPLEGAGFKMYKGTGRTKVYVYRDKDAGTEYVFDFEQNSDFSSDANGILWVGPLPYGVYYLYECTPPSGYQSKWFFLVVDEDTVYMSEGCQDDATAQQKYDTYKQTH